LNNEHKIHLLAFGSHPDDVELSAGGTLIKHKELGYTTGIIDLTRGELGTRGTAETRDKEAAASAKILRLDVRENLHLADGFFEESREALLRVVHAIRKYKPHTVLTNAISDRHPDHGAGSRLVTRACFLSGLKKIETDDLQPWRPVHVFHYIQDNFMKPEFVIDITQWHDKKMEAIAAFKTQFYDPTSQEPETPISTKEFWDILYGKDLLMGRYIGSKYGEGFLSAQPFEVKDMMK